MQRNVLPAVASLTLLLAYAATTTVAQNPAPDSTPPSASAGQDSSDPNAGVYRVGGGISAPKLVYGPDPEYSKEARKARYQGTVVLWLVVDADGLPKRIRVQRSLGMGLDEEAMKAVQRWRFRPATKDGKPVAVMINVQVNFQLYDLMPHPDSEGQPPRFPGVNTSEYPLVVRLVGGSQPSGDSTTMSYTATVAGAGQERQVSISCKMGSAHCWGLRDGTYPAKWQNGESELEILGLREGKGKWEKAEYVVAADTKNSQKQP